MNTKIFSVLKELIAEKGEDALNDITLVNAALSEKAETEPKPLRMVLLFALTADCGKELRSLYSGTVRLY